MKTVLLAILAITTSVSALYAQFASPQQGQTAGQISLGARGNWVVGFHDPKLLGEWIKPDITFDGEPAHYVSHGRTLSAGGTIFTSYALNSTMAIQLEFNFIDQGYDLRFTNPDNRSAVVDVSYPTVDIPVLFRYNFSKTRALMGVQIGPHISIPVGRLHIDESWSATPDYRWDERYGWEGSIHTDATFGFTAGMYLGIPVFRFGRIVGDVRYINDFNSAKIQDKGTTVAFITRRALIFGLGYEFSF